jgi:purine-binding chemotaxis protein CheW
MSTSDAQDFPWVVFELQSQLYAINTRHVREMIEIPKHTQLPEAASEVRGVIDLRGEIAVLLDTRRRLGLPSLEQETRALSELLHAREQDHINWLEALESALREQKPFQLTTDPHQCAFGKWYDRFHTDNPVLQLQLQAFAEPHKALHHLGVELIQMSESGQPDLALYRLEQARGSTLQRLINLFASTRELVCEHVREIALVLEWRDQLVALSVDTVSSVEHLDEEARQTAPALAEEEGARCVNELGQRRDSGQMVQLLDLEALLRPLQSRNILELVA